MLLAPRDDNESETTSLLRSGRKDRLHAFKKAIKRGNCTLKELIDQFYTIEERYMIQEYQDGIRTNYAYLQALTQPEGQTNEGPYMVAIKDFTKYSTEKKIKLKQHHVVEILRDESDQSNIQLISFIKLLILASCGGDRTKIGISNFKKLMKHMDIFK